MSVGVKTGSRKPSAPLNLLDSSGFSAPSPPLRQAAGRYVTLAQVAVKNY